MGNKKIALNLGHVDYSIQENQIGSDFVFAGKAPGEIINSLLPYVFIVSGLILLALLIIGGFEIMTSAGNPETTQKGQGKIVSAIIGFLIIFVAYWLAQALGIMLGFSLLGD